MLLDVMLAVCAPSSQGVKSCNLGECPHADEPFSAAPSECSLVCTLLVARVHIVQVMQLHGSPFPGSAHCAHCAEERHLYQGKASLFCWHEKGISPILLFLCRRNCVYSVLWFSLSLSHSLCLSNKSGGDVLIPNGRNRQVTSAGSEEWRVFGYSGFSVHQLRFLYPVCREFNLWSSATFIITVSAFTTFYKQTMRESLFHYQGDSGIHI